MRPNPGDLVLIDWPGYGLHGSRVTVREVKQDGPLTIVIFRNPYRPPGGLLGLSVDRVRVVRRAPAPKVRLPEQMALPLRVEAA